MKLVKSETRKDRFCNECKGQEDVKELYLGGSVLALCKHCRVRAVETLTTETKFYFVAYVYKPNMVTAAAVHENAIIRCKQPWLYLARMEEYTLLSWSEIPTEEDALSWTKRTNRHIINCNF